MCIHDCTYMYMCLYMLIHTCTYMYMYVYIYMVCMYVCTCTCMYVCMYNVHCCLCIVDNWPWGYIITPNPSGVTEVASENKGMLCDTHTAAHVCSIRITMYHVTLIYVCHNNYMTQSEKKALTTKEYQLHSNSYCFAVFERYQLRLTCRKYDTCLCYMPDVVGYIIYVK